MITIIKDSDTGEFIARYHSPDEVVEIETRSDRLSEALYALAEDIEVYLGI